MNRTVLAIGIIFLLIGVSIVSSTDINIKDIPCECPSFKSVYNSEEILSRGNIAYGYVASGGLTWGPCYFPLDNPGNITSLAPTKSGDFLTTGTWTCDDRWIAIEYSSGVLWEIDPETGDMWTLGGGGCGCGLSCNPVDEKLYYACGTGISCEGEVVCDLSGELSYLKGIAFDKNGILYGWNFSSLWAIDIETCEATLVGPLDILVFGDGHFDFETDILYFTTYTSTGQLYECDEDTGECTLIGNFEERSEITALAIPFDCENHPPSKPTIDGQTCGKPGVEYEYTFVSTDPEGHDIRYIIDWYSSGEYIVTPYYPSGEVLTLPHTWPRKGTFTISAMAQDPYGAESENGTLTVTMPRNKMLHISLFLRFLDNFPLIQYLLNILRWYN